MTLNEKIKEITDNLIVIGEIEIYDKNGENILDILPTDTDDFKTFYIKVGKCKYLDWKVTYQRNIRKLRGLKLNSDNTYGTVILWIEDDK